MRMQYLVETKSGKLGFVPRLNAEELAQLPDGFTPVYLCDAETYSLLEKGGKNVKLMCVTGTLKVRGYCD